MEKHYIVFDGRARRDEDEAAIFEGFDSESKSSATRYFKHEYKHEDAVLFEYDVDGNNLINGAMIAD